MMLLLALVSPVWICPSTLSNTTPLTPLDPGRASHAVMLGDEVDDGVVVDRDGGPTGLLVV